jgi:hypothetical protein
MDTEKIRNDKNLFEKILLAYWYSVPCDNTVLPDRVEITKDNGTFFNVNLIKNNVVFGMSCMQKTEIDRYFVELEKVKEHETDIIKRLDKEITTSKEKIAKKLPKKK